MDTQTLIKQLGTALPMMGAGPLFYGHDHAMFTIKGSRRGNKIKIVLDADDTYTVELWNVRGVDFRKVAEQSGVYADGLHQVLESLTGLYTRL